MTSHASKSTENHSNSSVVAQTKNDEAFAYADRRPETTHLKTLQQLADNSPQMDQARELQAVTQRKVNRTGLPDNLKSGIENLSGYSMDDVKVHYNSDKPADLQAHAYAQGTDIHVAPGQEQHLPHEAWHVVQQKQGRVKATRQLKSAAINDDLVLEREADVMGAKAVQLKTTAENGALMNGSADNAIVQRVLSDGEKLAIRAEIAAEQQIVDAHRATITAGSVRTRRRRGRPARTLLKQGLPRNRLTALIDSLTASIAARQNVVNLHDQLEEPDPGDHMGRIGIEQDLLAEAQTDRNSIRQIAATAWTADPNDPTSETRTAARWDRDPEITERRGVLRAEDGPGQFQAPGGRRARRARRRNQAGH